MPNRNSHAAKNILTVIESLGVFYILLIIGLLISANL